jgi:uncharacterized membrane protein YccC
VSARAPSIGDRLLALARRELGPEPGRVRAFGRSLVAILLAITLVEIFRPTNGYWTATLVLFLSSPGVGNSEREVLRQALACLVGCAAAVTLIIGAYDLPWLYVPLQALGIGTALFLTRTTPLGTAAFSGGFTFAVITGGSREVGAAGLIGLAFVRLLQATSGAVLGALVQLTLWREEPLVELRLSLSEDLDRAEALLVGQATPLSAGRVSRHFELLGKAEIRHPEIVRQRAEISLLVLQTAHLVDQSLLHERLPEDERARSAAIVRQMCVELRRFHEAGPFEPLPPPPRALQPGRWPSVLADNVRFSLKASLKVVLSAFVTLQILDAMQFTPAGGLLMCLVTGLQMSTGTDLSKPLTLFAGLLVGMAVTLLASRLAVPNVDDLGSYLLVGALALAPTVWIAGAGFRVRTAGLYGTILVMIGLFGAYRASSNLEPAVDFGVALFIGLLVVTATDLAIWSVDRERVMASRLAFMMRRSAELMGDLDPRTVLSPNSEPRWSLHREVLQLAQLRGETAPAPGTREFAYNEEVIRLATETQRLAVARVEQAWQELRGSATRADTLEQRRSWGEALWSRAERIEREGTLAATYSDRAPLTSSRRPR